MSNLLNNKNKKKLLNRGAAIVPEQQFDANTIAKEETPAKVVKEDKPKKPTASAKKNKSEASNTSLRVSKRTRNRLKAIIQYGKAENVDLLIAILLDEYLETHFTKEDKKTYDLILKLIENRNK